MHTLLVLRHGKSDWPDGVDDFDRPLKKRGRRDSGRMGQWIKAQGLVPDLIMTSSAKRARSTARRVCDALGVSQGVVTADPGLYLASPEVLLARLDGCAEAHARVLLVGHNPGLEQLVARFAGRPVRMPTCALAVIAVDGPWADIARAGGRLAHLIRPRELEPA